MEGALIWVPSGWVAAGLVGLAGAEAEIVALGRGVRGEPRRNVISGAY